MTINTAEKRRRKQRTHVLGCWTYLGINVQMIENDQIRIQSSVIEPAKLGHDAANVKVSGKPKGA